MGKNNDQKQRLIEIIKDLPRINPRIKKVMKRGKEIVVLTTEGEIIVDIGTSERLAKS